MYVVFSPTTTLPLLMLRVDGSQQVSGDCVGKGPHPASLQLCRTRGSPFCLRATADSSPQQWCQQAVSVSLVCSKTKTDGVLR